ncbi:MAG: hypothetical protein ACI379_12395 [Nocardioides sp.]|uniref:hypothetical protein n=1 Tax=Nocardioides sp. TaxID=35761 RepID=UPI003F01D662
MSHIRHLAHAAAVEPPRVRHQARDVLALVAFSAGLSTAVAFLLVLVVRLGGQG